MSEAPTAHPASSLLLQGPAAPALVCIFEFQSLNTEPVTKVIGKDLLVNQAAHSFSAGKYG